MLPNFGILAASALIPMVLGYIWFHPNLFGGNKWYDLAKLHGDDRSDVSNVKLFFTLILNFIIAFGLYNFTVHQMGAFGMVGGDAELLKTGVGGAFMDAYGHTHQNFGHGFFHGIIFTILIPLPILGYVSIFEKKSFGYFLVYLGYWAISLSLMGAVLSQWGTTQL